MATTSSDSTPWGSRPSTTGPSARSRRRRRRPGPGTSASASHPPWSPSGWGGSALTSKISTLRLRAAIGQSGLQPSAFAKFTTFEPLASSAGPGLTPSNLGNLDLRPEKTTEWEVGSEIGVLGDRAAVDVTYWKRVTRDALYPRQFAPSGGVRNTQLTNIGRIDAAGC